MLRDQCDPRSRPRPCVASPVGTCHRYARTSRSTRVEWVGRCSYTRLLLRRCGEQAGARDPWRSRRRTIRRRTGGCTCMPPVGRDSPTGQGRAVHPHLRSDNRQRAVRRKWIRDRLDRRGVESAVRNLLSIRPQAHFTAGGPRRAEASMSGASPRSGHSVRTSQGGGGRDTLASSILNRRARTQRASLMRGQQCPPARLQRLASGLDRSRARHPTGRSQRTGVAMFHVEHRRGDRDVSRETRRRISARSRGTHATAQPAAPRRRPPREGSSP